MKSKTAAYVKKYNAQYRKLNRKDIKKYNAEHYRLNRLRILNDRKLERARWTDERRNREKENKARERLAHPRKYKRLMHLWRKRNPERLKAHARKSNYNIDSNRYELMLKKQNHKCGICRKDFTKKRVPHVDHDHGCCSQGARSCGRCVRGLLCSNCNRGIGNFEDNKKSLRSAIKYLGRF